MMTTNEIRTKFLDFFKSKGHTIIASDSLVPKDDPTVLFTTAGMQQFKRQFLGHIDGYTRASTSQKCLRTDDLDKVGKTDFHHTFFEMLGNFSFGDYFKKEAIAWGWEFLTRELKLPAEKLCVSVYKEDDEAYDIWLKEIKVPAAKIYRLGDKSNFWPSNARIDGPNGPCGPCSEIFYDYGVNPNCKNPDCNPDCSCGRFCEVWNLVFTQFNRKDGGVLEPLPAKNIDTGMGLERLVAVIQGKKSNFDTDLFEPIFEAIDEKVKVPTQYERRVMADHIRAITFGICDGVIPSNEGRGYVIKKLIIDITDMAVKAGHSKPVVYQLIDAVVESMGETYPDIKKKKSDIAGIVRNIEESYIKVRKERIPELEKKLDEIKSLAKSEQAKELGKTKFIYRDTYGLTVPTITTVVLSKDFDADIVTQGDSEFTALMEAQQNKSRQSSKMTGDVFTDTGMSLNVPKTEFLGYSETKSQSKLLKIIVGEQESNQAQSGDQVKIILDKTPFYAEAGGQVGDTGIVTGPKGKIQIKDTQKLDDVYIHSGIVTEGTISKDETVTAQIDEERRNAIMKNHTATHLLQAALRSVLGSHVQQQGSLVDENRLRFDFTQPKPIAPEEISAIEKQVNEVVLKKVNVEIEKLKLEEAKKKGALAFFAEKYGNEVRVVSIGDYSKEFCGGTHLKNTGDIELFKIVSHGSVAQGIRRLEAKTGLGAKSYLKEKDQESVERENLAKLKTEQEQSEKKRFSEVLNSVPEDLKKCQVINGTTVFTKKIDEIGVEYLKRIADHVKQVAPSSLVVLGTQNNGSGTIVVAVTDDLVQKGVRANDIVKEIASLIGGSGGGRPQMAQAGSKEPGKIEQAIKNMPQFIKDKVKL